MADEFLDDGTVDWSFGQDSWHDPARIQASQYYKGVNVTSVAANLSPRFGFHERPLKFADTSIKSKTIVASRTIESIWSAGKFQAMIPFPLGSDYYLITVVCGLIYRTNISSWTTALLSEDIFVNQYSSRINWSYAKDKIVLFDYPNRPVIIDGVKVHRADPTKDEVPISTNGAYNQNRLFILNNGAEFTGGDPVGSIAAPDAPITFKEVLTSGSPFFDQFFASSTGEALYPFRAIGFVQNLDTSTGIGSLFIATQNKFLFFNTQNPRDDWTKQQFEGILLQNSGIAGPASFVNADSDIVFMSQDADVHSVNSSRNSSGKWANIPISREVEKYIPKREPGLFQFAVMGIWNNRIFLSVNPYRVRAQDRLQQPVTDYAHAGMVVINIENGASLLAQGTPVWDGLWTGVNPMAICTINNRCFVMSKDGEGANGYNRLYEMNAKKCYDTVLGRKRNVRAIIYTREYECNSPYLQKQEYSVAFQPKDISGDFRINIEKKVSHSHEFVPYADWRFDAVTRLKTVPKTRYLNGLAYFNPGQVTFGESEDQEAANPITEDLYRVYYAAQFRLTISAEYWQLRHFKVRTVPWNQNELVDDTAQWKPQPLALQCIPDWLIPGLDNCDSV